jgi:hypothetical protein
MPQPPAKQFSGIFVCYRRDDSSGHAGRLFDKLVDHFGKDRIFMDIDTIEPGEDFIEVIENAVGSCEILIAMIGRQWLSSADETYRRLDNPNDFVRLEITAALNRDIHIIPVLVQGATMPRPHELPTDLSKISRRNAHELSDLRWQRDVAQLINVLERIFVRLEEEQRSTAQRDEDRRQEAEHQRDEEATRTDAAERQRLEEFEAEKREVADSIRVTAEEHLRRLETRRPKSEAAPDTPTGPAEAVKSKRDRQKVEATGLRAIIKRWTSLVPERGTPIAEIDPAGDVDLRNRDLESTLGPATLNDLPQRNRTQRQDDKAAIKVLPKVGGRSFRRAWAAGIVIVVFGLLVVVALWPWNYPVIDTHNEVTVQPVASPSVSPLPSGTVEPKSNSILSISVRVPAQNVPAQNVTAQKSPSGWTNSGLAVRRGQRLSISATGSINLGGDRYSDPAGDASLLIKDKLMRSEASGALIAVIGDDNDDFIFIGNHREFTAQRDGVLFLGVNEDNVNDDTGYYTAVIDFETPDDR